MTDYAPGGELVQLVEIDQSFCLANTYGQAPCTAALGVTGESKCYNTPSTCQDIPNYDDDILTLVFGTQQVSLPRNQHIFPYVKSVRMTPSEITEGGRQRSNTPLGKRASVTITFDNPPWTDRIVDKYYLERPTGAAGLAYDPIENGTFWGKWRARNPHYSGRILRVKSGVVNQAGILDLSTLTTRTYVIENFSIDTSRGTATIVAKDLLTFLDDEKAQAPLASVGEIGNVGGITAAATSLTLSPAGIGNSDYPASGYVVVGDEVMAFTRSGDTLTLTRGQFNTTAESHDENDTVQLCLEYNAVNVSNIVNDLLVNYTKIPSSFIPKATWDTEVANNIPNNYNALITEPTSVRKLIGELSEQAGFNFYWNEEDSLVELVAVKTPDFSAPLLTEDNAIIYPKGVDIADRPDARISQVWVYYGIIKPTENLTQFNNYRNTLVSVDATAESDIEYGEPGVRKIPSRWINQFGKAAALDVSDRLLQRYRDIPRIFNLQCPSYLHDTLKIGEPVRIKTRDIESVTGQESIVPALILSVRDKGDVLDVKAEEQLFTAREGAGDGVLRVFISNNYTGKVGDTDEPPYNLYEEFKVLYGTPTGTQDIECIVESGVKLGINSTGTPAFNAGAWTEGYNSLKLIIESGAVISGKGGDGGNANTTPDPEDGEDGGTAIYTRTTMTVDNSGTIQGGGGGGGAGEFTFVFPVFNWGGGGGGGAGRTVGQGGVGGNASENGQNGTLTTGGAGGVDNDSSGQAGDGGDGGGPGLAGQDGTVGSVGGVPGSGGAAGNAVDGVSFITYSPKGTVTGPEVN